MKRVLLAEDDIDFGAILKQYLELNKFEVEWTKNGEDAYKVLEKNKFDICLLDVMMPKMDGFTLAKKIINKNPEMPFLFLTARITQDDVIKGLKLGADDYITKPFEVEELVLRLNNIIKRTQQQKGINTNKDQQIITIGNYEFDIKNLQLKFNNTAQQLTEKEVQLIYFLFINKNELVRREDILTKIWNNNDFFSGRSMDVFISRIRKYFNEDPNISIESARGVGLIFRVRES